ncbi:MAG: hypothetical protein AAF614_18930 [Chloroflexota bacterium]
MNHPIITTVNADARLNQLIQTADQHRLAKNLAPKHQLGSLFAAIGNRLSKLSRKSTKKRLAGSSA